jgi:tetratricopeptide (TPR) repeat protein
MKARSIRHTRRAAPIWVPAVTLAAVLAVKLVVLFQLHDHPLLQPAEGLDSQTYVELARRVASGDLGLGPAPFFVAPLYAYVLGLLLAISGGSLLFAQCGQVLLGTAAVALIAVTARRWQGPRAAWTAGALAAATGVFTFHEVLILQAALDPFLTALGLFLLARALPNTGGASFLAAGTAFGLLALNRPNALACALFIAGALLARRATRQRWLQAGAFAAGLALAIAPATLRNLAVAGEPVLISSHGGLNFYIGNNAEADGTYHAVPGITPNISGQARDATRVAEVEEGRALSAGEVSNHFTRKAWAWIRSEPGAAARLFLLKLACIFNETELALNYSYRYYSQDEPTLLRLLAVGPWLLVPLGLTGLLFGPQRTAPGFAVWASFVPAYALSLAAFFVSGRYRLPVLVPLCVGGGCALELLWTARTQRRTRLSAAALCAGALAAVALWPLPLDEGRTAEREQMALWLIDQGRLGEARALVGEGDLGQARSELARAHEVKGVAFAQQGRADAALRELEEAVRLDPASASARLNLAVVHAQQGRLEQARALVDEALRLRPGYPQALGLRDELARAAGPTGRRPAIEKR